MRRAGERRARRRWRGALLGALLLAPLPARADEAFDYVMHCRGCHGPEGQGAPGGAPDLRDSLGRLLTVAGGREYLIRVPGTAQSELDDARTAALLTWMVRRFGPAEAAAGFRPFTAAEVTAYRRPVLLDPAAERARLLADR